MRSGRGQLLTAEPPSEAQPLLERGPFLYVPSSTVESGSAKYGALTSYLATPKITFFLRASIRFQQTPFSQSHQSFPGGVLSVMSIRTFAGALFIRPSLTTYVNRSVPPPRRPGAGV